ncbi:hypothetical protein [Xanthomonas phage SB3]|uniref:Uncharacterized protein n=1 Tax=Xanthomonas phage SB3 TaxID=3117472 RepID=A0ABZ2GVN1_9CAUD
MQLTQPKEMGPHSMGTLWCIRGRILDTEGKVFTHDYVIPDTDGAVAPEKMRHFHHNKARNALTKAMIEYKYPE